MASVALVVHRGGEGARQLQKRLEGLAARGRNKPTVDAVRDERYSSIQWMDKALHRVNLGQRLELMLYQAGMTMRVGALVLLIAGFGMGGYFLGLLLTHRIAPALVVMAAMMPLP